MSKEFIKDNKRIYESILDKEKNNLNTNMDKDIEKTKEDIINIDNINFNAPLPINLKKFQEIKLNEINTFLKKKLNRDE